MTSPKEALVQAKWLYDQLALSPLDAAAKYGDEYEPPTDEQCLEIREMVESAIPVAELDEQAWELLKHPPNPGTIPELKEWWVKARALLAQRKALK